MKVQLLFLLVIALTILQLAYTKVDVENPPDCGGAEAACTSCRTGEYCPETENGTAIIGCPLGWVCSPDALPVCKDITTLYPDECGCPEGVVGQFRDPYDSHRYFTCDNGNAEYSSCPSDMYFSETRQQCVALAPCTVRGCYPIVEECGVYYCCELGSDGQYSQTFKGCQYGYVYDETIGTCIDPFFDCTGLPDGFYQDPLRTDVVHTCNNENDLYTACCPLGLVYEPYNHTCLEPSPSDKPGLIGICYDQYWEQYCRQRCDYLDETYESHNECSQYYFECFESQPDLSLHASAMQCPGDEVYNPGTGGCDRKDHVEGCSLFLL